MREDFFGFGPPWQVSPKEQPLRPGAASPGMFHCRDWRLCGMSEINRVYFCYRSRTAIQHEKKQRALPELRAHRLHERTSDNRPIMTNWMVFWNPASQCAVTLIFVWYQQITRSLWTTSGPDAHGKSRQITHVHTFCIILHLPRCGSRLSRDAISVQQMSNPNAPQMSSKGWENPSSFLYGFQCAPFFDRQKLIWRTLDALRTNFWGEKWENQKQSRWVGCKLIQIRRCAKPIINSCNHDHNLLWCPKAVPVFHHWDWMDWGMFFWTSPKHTQTVFLNCIKYYQFSESLAMLFSEAVIAVQLRNSMFPLALRWSALRPPPAITKRYEW